MLHTILVVLTKDIIKDTKKYSSLKKNKVQKLKNKNVINVNNIIIIMDAIINNIIKYQKENNIIRMCGPTVVWLYEICQYWFKDIHINVKPSIVICMRGGQQIILSGHVNIIINGVLKETSYEVLNLISESDSYVYYHNWHDTGLCGLGSRHYLEEFLRFNDIANNINKGWGLVEDEKIKKYLDDLQRVTNSTIKNNQYLKIL